jgi:hypothetical protein
MQSSFRPATRRKWLGEQSEGDRRDGDLKLLCIMLQTWGTRVGRVAVEINARTLIPRYRLPVVGLYGPNSMGRPMGKTGRLWPA